MEKRWLKVEEAAALLGIHKVTLYKLCKAGRIAHARIKGVGLRVDGTRLEQMIEKQVIVPAEK
jgi:excisionase family DNA binding protein